MIELLLINILFLLLPVVIYLIFFENRIHTYNKPMIIFLSSITMVLCMTFPIKLDPGFIFDLRYIPFIIASLFGGYSVAFPLYLVLNIYRFIIGGDGVLLSLITSTVVFIVVPLLSQKFHQFPSKKRIVTAFTITFIFLVAYLSMLSTFYQPITKVFWFIVIDVLTIHLGGVIIIMVLIEKILFNIKKCEKIVDTDRLTVISELSASISHEIRNPLTVTKGFLQMLDKSNNINEDEKRYVNFSLQELERAERIVSDFLSLAKPQASNMVTSNLEEEFVYVNNVMVAYANIHQVDLQYTFNNDHLITYDKNQLRQCLINLYKNSIEAMKDNGGTLTVTVTSEKRAISIQIKDSGVGMTKEEVVRLGKPYYSTKDDGTGLGMIIVFSAVHRLGGKIKVESEKEKGTTFLLILPVSKQKNDTNQ
ncbi:ATP-binding protein [Anaerobacillus sp. MEB173]|uniref:ATP-binding protein n=1 Tax=Anaerobacillus sp. MEB173 TaxID=3383345 RepID=UPI003F919F30